MAAKKKVVKKKVAKKKVAKKKVAKKKVTESKKTLLKQNELQLTKEDAIKKYKESKKQTLSSDHEQQRNLELFNTPAKIKSIEKKPNEISIEELDENGVPVNANTDSNMTDYNPDDESDDHGNEGSYGYGWGYSDAFDSPEEEGEEY